MPDSINYDVTLMSRGDWRLPLSIYLTPLIAPFSPQNRGDKGREIGNLGVWVGKTDPNTQISGEFPFPLEGEGSKIYRPQEDRQGIGVSDLQQQAWRGIETGI
jgi:hypothetical protein